MLFAEEAELSLLSEKLLWKYIFNETFESAIKICQWDPLIIPTLKNFTKGAITGAFRRATCTKPSSGKTTTEM